MNKNNNVHQRRVKKRSQDLNFRKLCNKCNKYHVESTEMTAINSKTSLELENLEYRFGTIK